MAQGADDPAVPECVRRALRALRDRASVVFGPRLVELKLFGSFARGEQHAESDVDVLVVCEGEPSDEDREQLFREVAEIARGERVWIAPLLLSRSRFQQMLADERQLALDVQAEGIPV